MKIAVNDYLELYTDDDKMGYVVDARTGEKYPQTSLASILSKGYWTMVDDEITEKGGPGSGNFNHAGRPGEVGGSAPSKTGADESIIPEDVVADSYARLLKGGYSKGTYDVAASGHEATLMGWLFANQPDSLSALSVLGERWEDLSDDERGKLKDQIVTRLSQETGIPYEKVNDIVGGWAETSNDSSYRALFVQNCISEEFGVPLSDWQREHWETVQFGAGLLAKYQQEYNDLYQENLRAFQGNDPALRKELFSRAGQVDYGDDLNYQDQQYIAKLAAARVVGKKISREMEAYRKKASYSDIEYNLLSSEITTVLTGEYWRGNRMIMPSYTKDEAKKVLRAMYNDTQAYFESKGIKYVYLFRGAGAYFDNMAGSVGKLVNYHGNAAEAWSISARIAMSFGGTMIRKIPAKDILCTSRTGMGCIVEGEVITLNNDNFKAQLIYVEP